MNRRTPSELLSEPVSSTTADFESGTRDRDPTPFPKFEPEETPQGSLLSDLGEPIPAKYAGIFRAAWDRSSARKAIRAKCLDCCCFDAAEVKRCRLIACALWGFRMGGRAAQERADQDWAQQKEAHR
jgi:hypothetical protein